MAKAGELGYLVNLDSDLRMNKPQLDITIDRERAAQLGVSVADIGGTLETLLGGRVATQFKRGSKQYDVILQMRPGDTDNAGHNGPEETPTVNRPSFTKFNSLPTRPSASTICRRDA